MVRTFTTVDGVFPADLLRSGIDHFKAATLLFGAGPSYLDSAGYLAHMAAEQMLKAWLSHLAGQYKGIHVLRELHHELVTSWGAVPMSAEHEKIRELLDKYDQLRYPNRANPIEIGNDDLPMIEEFICYLFNSLPEPLRLTIERVNPVEKGGRVLMKKQIKPQA